MNWLKINTTTIKKLVWDPLELILLDNNKKEHRFYLITFTYVLHNVK